MLTKALIFIVILVPFLHPLIFTLPPYVTLINTLYCFDLKQSELEEEDEHNVFWIFINNVKIKFVEERYYIQVSIEGELSNKIVRTLKQQLLAKVSVLENTACEIEDF